MKGSKGRRRVIGGLLIGVTAVALAGSRAAVAAPSQTEPQPRAAQQDLPRELRVVATRTLAGQPAPGGPPRGAEVSSAVATLTPAPPASPAATSPPSVPAAAAIQGSRRDWIEVPSVGVSVAVGVYSDCTGQTPLTRATAARDTCVPPGEVFLVGHRPGVFSALPGVTTGAMVDYWDSTGVLHAYRLYLVSMVPKSEGGSVMTSQHPALLMQTCDDGTGSYYYFYGSPL